MDCWIGRKSCCSSERKQACDKDIKPYIRPKRNINYLPDSWNTKWINVRQFRNWKHRCKKKHQWEKHKQTPDEICLVTGSYPDSYIMHIYCRNKWIRIKHEHMDSVKKLIKSGILKAGYAKVKYYSCKNNKVITHTKKILTFARKNEN